MKCREVLWVLRHTSNPEGVCTTKRNPGTCKVHTGSQKPSLLSLIRGVQTHYPTLYLNYSLENVSSWNNLGGLGWIVTVTFKIVIFIALLSTSPLPYFYLLDLNTYSRCMLPHGLLSMGLTLFVLSASFQSVALNGTLVCFQTRLQFISWITKSNFQLPAWVSFLVFLFHPMQPFASTSISK